MVKENKIEEIGPIAEEMCEKPEVSVEKIDEDMIVVVKGVTSDSNAVISSIKQISQSDKEFDAED